MRAPKQARYETFNDGICTICKVGIEGENVPVIEGLRFCDRVIGATRHYAAVQVQTRISRVIRIPQQRRLQYTHRVVIDGVVYEIEQVQHIGDTCPAVTDMTLRVWEMFGGE